MASEDYPWKFRRDGGVDQVFLKTGEDIARLSELDKKLWVALACPVKGTEIDEETLALVDTDFNGNGRLNRWTLTDTASATTPGLEDLRVSRHCTP